MFHGQSNQLLEVPEWRRLQAEVESKELEELPREAIAWWELVQELLALPLEFLEYLVGNDYLINRISQKYKLYSITVKFESKHTSPTSRSSKVRRFIQNNPNYHSKVLEWRFLLLSLPVLEFTERLRE